MTVELSMPGPLLNLLNKVADDLQDFIDAQREAMAEMPDEWHDGDQAESVEMWLDGLDRAVSDINDVQFSCME